MLIDLQKILADRNATYGPATVDFKLIAALWSALKGVPFTAADVPKFFILAKVARSMHTYKPDNFTDIAGYAAKHEDLFEEIS